MTYISVSPAPVRVLIPTYHVKDRILFYLILFFFLEPFSLPSPAAHFLLALSSLPLFPPLTSSFFLFSLHSRFSLSPSLPSLLPFLGSAGRVNGALGEKEKKTRGLWRLRAIPATSKQAFPGLRGRRLRSLLSLPPRKGWTPAWSLSSSKIPLKTRKQRIIIWEKV